MTKFLKLRQDHIEDLSYLNEIKPEIVNNLCKVSINFIMDGANKRIISRAAQKLKVSEKEVEKAITALSFLFSECAKSRLNATEFKMTISEIEIDDNIKKLLVQLYKDNRKEIRNLFIASDHFFGIPQYKNLHWRLDMVMGKRNLSAMMEHRYTIKLQTSLGEDKEVKTKLLTGEYHDLKYITTQLENALSELKNVHVRRIRKYVKV